MRSFSRLVVPAFLLFFSVAGCRSAPASEAVELRVYDVPKGTGSSIVATFKDVMWMGENTPRAGRAAVTPEGKLAVLAPPSVQAGVMALVEAVTKNPPAPDQNVELHYFLILGKPATAPQPYPAGTSEIKSALDEIVRSQGPQTFTLGQRANLSTLNDEDGGIDLFPLDAKLEIKQHLVKTTDGVYAKVLIRWKEDKIETRMHLGGDRVVVLGATGQRAGDAGDASTLYYVVRVAPRPDGKTP